MIDGCLTEGEEILNDKLTVKQASELQSEALSCVEHKETGVK